MRPDVLVALLRLLLFTSATLGVTACVQRNPATQKLETVLISRAKEEAIGRRLLAECLKRTPLTADLSLRKRVSLVSEQIASAIGLDQDNESDVIHISVVEDQAVNAYALPGRRVVVTTGTLEFVGDDDDLMAAVLSHEMAHVHARHVARRLEAAITLSGVVGAARLGARRRSGRIHPAVDIGTRFLSRQYEHEQEYEADALALGYLRAAGYSPAALPRLLESWREATAAAPSRRRHSPVQIDKRLKRLRAALARPPDTSDTPPP